MILESILMILESVPDSGSDPPFRGAEEGNHKGRIEYNFFTPCSSTITRDSGSAASS